MNYCNPKIFAVKHKDNEIRMSSRSGGIFTALSDEILNHKGIVYGCAMDTPYSAMHIRAENFEERDQMRGSKYIQSNMRNIFQRVKSDLDNGKEVLFSGTSCQISGLKGFLSKEYEKLVCVDIVCHGVPSPLVWKEYVKWQERRYNSKAIKVEFRNKRDFGWDAHVETLKLENEQIINGRIFANIFYSHNILRPCCYKCPYKAIVHPGDITIADYWGIDNIFPEFNDNKGVSLVLINNEKGFKLFNNIKEQIKYREGNLESCLQPPLVAPYEKPATREQFWEDFYAKSFSFIARKYGEYGQINNLKRKLRRILHKIVRE